MNDVPFENAPALDDDVAALLADLTAYVCRYVILTPAQAAVVALWIVHTHAVDAAEATAYLAVTSAEKRSGKTRLLEVLALVVARPWFTGRVTAAVLARKVDAEQPTLRLDESDAAFKGDKDYAEALRGILNTGYRRGGKTTVCTGQGAKSTTRTSRRSAPRQSPALGSCLTPSPTARFRSDSSAARRTRQSSASGSAKSAPRRPTCSTTSLGSPRKRVRHSLRHARSYRRNSTTARSTSPSRCSRSPTLPAVAGRSKRGRRSSSSVPAATLMTTRSVFDCSPTSAMSSTTTGSRPRGSRRQRRAAVSRRWPAGRDHRARVAGA